MKIGRRRESFEPLTSQLGIPGTSYRIQLGLINNKWASRLLKGHIVIDSYIYKDEDIAEGGFPNQDLIVGWVLRTVAIPNINPHQVAKTTQALVKQAIEPKMSRGYRPTEDFPYPYIFKPPKPPDDIAVAGVAPQLKVQRLNSEEEADNKLICKYCGSKLVKEQKFCRVCGNKFVSL